MEPAPSTKRHQESYGNRGKLYCIKAYEDNIIRNPVHLSLSLSLYIIIYIHTLSFHIPRKRGLCKISHFSEWKPGFPMFSFGCIVGGFDAGLLTGFYGIYIYNIYVFFTFDGLAKPAFPPTAGFRHQNPLFFWVLAQKKMFFCPATHFFPGYGSHRYIYIYLSLSYIYIHGTFI